ncbi:hypothetical protein BJX61DRAFT_64943 [Aspergillus egyptiacus]|nr:hypothetical protein BJX61DRAFT_64943 [Aspergillus egyptiacus]
MPKVYCKVSILDFTKVAVTALRFVFPVCCFQAYVLSPGSDARLLELALLLDTLPLGWPSFTRYSYSPRPMGLTKNTQHRLNSVSTFESTTKPKLWQFISKPLIHCNSTYYLTQDHQKAIIYRKLPTPMSTPKSDGYPVNFPKQTSRERKHPNLLAMASEE